MNNFNPETNASLIAEDVFKQHFESNLNQNGYDYRLKKLPPTLYRADWAVVKVGKNNLTLGVLEFKERDYSYEQLDRFGGYMVSLAKAQHLRFSAVDGLAARIYLKLNGVPNGTYYRWKCPECIKKYKKGFWDYENHPKRQSHRNDSEPTLIIPMSEFEKITLAVEGTADVIDFEASRQAFLRIDEE